MRARVRAWGRGREVQGEGVWARACGRGRVGEGLWVRARAWAIVRLRVGTVLTFMQALFKVLLLCHRRAKVADSVDDVLKVLQGHNPPVLQKRGEVSEVAVNLAWVNR